MFQESEIITLVVALVGAFLLTFVFTRRKVPELGFFYAGFFFIVAASLFTVAEGVIWNTAFNLLEHLCYVFSAVSFIAGCLLLGRRPGAEGEGN